MTSARHIIETQPDDVLASACDGRFLEEHLQADGTLRAEHGRMFRHQRGKVREILVGDDELLLITTDRASAFDYVWGTVPLKGQLLNQCAAWWFSRSAEIVPNHMRAMPDPALMVATRCTPLPVEFVVRGFLTGTTATSILTHYAAGTRSFCGHKLPDGLHPHERLPRPLVTPSTKAAQGAHDVNASRASLIDAGLVSAEDFDAASHMALALFELGQTLCAEKDLLLVDTKYEFGKDANGNLLLIDEVHTPDSSRFWRASGYESALSKGEDPPALDKDHLRRFLRARNWHTEGPSDERRLPDALRLEAAARYAESCEMICGKMPVALGDAGARISPVLDRFLVRSTGNEP